MTLEKNKKTNDSQKKASALKGIYSCRGACGRWRLKPWQRGPGKGTCARSNLSFSSAVRRERAEQKEKSQSRKTELNHCGRRALNALAGLLHTDHSAGEAAERYQKQNNCRLEHP